MFLSITLPGLLLALVVKHAPRKDTGVRIEKRRSSPRLIYRLRAKSSLETAFITFSSARLTNAVARRNIQFETLCKKNTLLRHQDLSDIVEARLDSWPL